MEKLTYHCEIERASRVEQIVTNIGLGQVVKEKFYRGCFTCITDTGVTIIKSPDKLKVVTMYVTTMQELVFVYGGTKKIPSYLRKKVDHNQSLFTMNKKTIWN